MAFMMAKKNTETQQKMEQCDQQLKQLDEQIMDCLVAIGSLYASKTTVEQAAGTPYEEMLTELDRIEARRELLEKRKLAIQNQRKCEKCGAVLNLDSVFCNKCGEKLEAIAPEVLTDAPLCPNCKQPIEEGSTFCTHCGASVEGEAEAQSASVGGNVCPSCGAVCDVADAFCINCGAKLG